MLKEEMEWVNVLRHGTSGELYLATYGANGPIDRICGPVDEREITADVDPQWEPEDVAWANEQPWALVGTLADR